MFNWNIRGINTPGRQLELKRAIEQHKPHIITLQETFLNITSKFYVDQYRIHRNDRLNAHGGGVAILVRRDVPHRSTNISTLKPFELCSVAISVNGRKVTISSLYTPRHTPTFKRNIARLLTIPDHFLFGDFNARHDAWNGSTPNQAGKDLLDMITDNNLCVLHPPVHTYMSPRPGHTESTIDHLVTNSLISTSVPVRDEAAFSDHWAFVTQIGIGI